MSKLDGLVPAEKIARLARKSAKAAPEPSEEERELTGQRDRLVERFTVMQSELGGVFYEMAIRDHVRMDVLTRMAAKLQRVDAELAAVERALRGEDGPPVANCPSCEAPHAADARFCSNCGHPLLAELDLSTDLPSTNGNAA
jgi:zinc-ribbon domain